MAARSATSRVAFSDYQTHSRSNSSERNRYGVHPQLREDRDDPEQGPAHRCRGVDVGLGEALDVIPRSPSSVIVWIAKIVVPAKRSSDRTTSVSPARR